MQGTESGVLHVPHLRSRAPALTRPKAPATAYWRGELPTGALIEVRLQASSATGRFDVMLDAQPTPWGLSGLHVQALADTCAGASLAECLDADLDLMRDRRTQTVLGDVARLLDPRSAVSSTRPARFDAYVGAVQRWAINELLWHGLTERGVPAGRRNDSLARVVQALEQAAGGSQCRMLLGAIYASAVLRAAVAVADIENREGLVLTRNASDDRRTRRVTVVRTLEIAHRWSRYARRLRRLAALHPGTPLVLVELRGRRFPVPTSSLALELPHPTDGLLAELEDAAYAIAGEPPHMLPSPLPPASPIPWPTAEYQPADGSEPADRPLE